MSYYIIIRGPLGIGKSTIAKKLSKTLGEKAIQVDTVMRRHNLDKVDKDLGVIPIKNFIKANEIILPKIKKALKQGKIVILDGCFYHKEQIEHFIDKLPYPHYIFTLKAPLKVCIQRDKKREKVYGEEAAKIVHEFTSKFDYGTVIDTENKSINETVKEIVSYLPN